MMLHGSMTKASSVPHAFATDRVAPTPGARKHPAPRAGRTSPCTRPRPEALPILSSSLGQTMANTTSHSQANPCPCWAPYGPPASPPKIQHLQKTRLRQASQRPIRRRHQDPALRARRPLHRRDVRAQRRQRRVRGAGRGAGAADARGERLEGFFGGLRAGEEGRGGKEMKRSLAEGHVVGMPMTDPWH